VTWEELNRIKKEINSNQEISGVCERKPIRGKSRIEIIEQLDRFFDYIAKNYPDRTFGLSPLALHYAYRLAARDKMFAMTPFSFIRKELWKLTGNQTKILFACKLFASFEEETRGEFFAGLDRIASVAGVSPTHIHKDIKVLKKSGFITNLRRHKSGTWVRKLNLSGGD